MERLPKQFHGCLKTPSMASASYFGSISGQFHFESRMFHVSRFNFSYNKNLPGILNGEFSIFNDSKKSTIFDVVY